MTCRYTRDSEIEKYTPSCCEEYDPAFDEILPSNSVDPEDAEEWTFCPYCGEEIKLKDVGSDEQ